MKTMMTYIMLLCLGFSATACNTVEGLGRDIEAGGDAIEDTAHDAKHNE